MDTPTWFELILLVATAVFFALVVAADAHTHAVPISRQRLAALTERAQPREEALRHYVEERHFLLACLAWARALALGVLIILALLLAVDGDGAAWWRFLVTGLGVVIPASMLQAIIRILVSKRPESWAIVVGPTSALVRLFTGPLVLVFEAPARSLARRLRGDDAAARTTREAEDLLRLVEMEEEAGVIEEEEREMIRGVIRLVDTQALDVMVPRTDVVAIDSDAGFDELTGLIVSRGKSRIPLYEGGIDNIVGVIYAKEVLRFLASGTRPASLREIARPPYFIPETKRVDELLTEFRRHKVHFAVVVDEYGGTAGVVTLEDLVEEIVGEIEDEYDVAEVTVERVSESEAIVDGRVPVDQVNDLFETQIQHEDFDTIGGLVLSELGRMPLVGDRVQVNGLAITVLSVVGRRIKKVRVLHEARLPREDERQAT